MHRTRAPAPPTPKHAAVPQRHLPNNHQAAVTDLKLPQAHGIATDPGHHATTPCEWPICRSQTWSDPSRRRLAPLPMRSSRPLWLGLMVAAVLILVDTVLVRLLASVAPHTASGTVYVLGAVAISASWAIGLAIMSRLVSGAVQPKAHLNAYSGWLPANPVDLVLHAAEARRAADQVSELAQRQAALRRVATLVARGVSPSAVFTAVADEVANALRVENCVLVRYLGDESCELVAAHDKASLDKIPVGARFPLYGDNVAAMVLRRGTTARMDSHEHAAGPIAAAVRDVGIRSAVGAPIDVDGRLWGAAVIASSGSEPHDPHTEARLADFAELVATAIANAQARDELMASRARIVA